MPKREELSHSATNLQPTEDIEEVPAQNNPASWY